MSELRSIVVLSTADWDATVWTNKQHVARAFRDCGYRVLYVESMGLRAPSVRRGDVTRMLRRLRRLVSRPVEVENGIWRWSPPSIPLQRYRFVRRINRCSISVLLRVWVRRLLAGTPLYWTYNPLSLELIRFQDQDQLAYHCVDDVAAQPGMPKDLIERSEVELVRRANAVFVTSRALEAKLSDEGSVMYLPNAVDTAAFGAEAVEPADVAEIPRPRLAFIGSLASYKQDLGILRELAVRGVGSVVVVGPVEQDDSEVRSLLETESIYYLGVRGANEVPAYMKSMDVGLIPSRLNRYTESMFPMKFFEYLAADLPIVSTPLSSLVDYRDLAIFAEREEFPEAVRRVLSGSWVVPARARDVVAENSYVVRTQRMLAQVQRSS